MVKALVLGMFLCSAPAALPSDLNATLESADFTVVEFFSPHCACQRAHDERIRNLAAAFAPRVQFIAVDSEATATIADDARERASRNYPFPIVTDADGKWADALAASYATFVTVIDRRGEVVYRGGIDSDKQHLTDDASFFLRDTLVALTHGEKPPRTETRALGCVLRRQ